jgi:hypothetical protein
MDRRRTCTKWPPNLLGNGHRDEINVAPDRCTRPNEY